MIKPFRWLFSFFRKPTPVTANPVSESEHSSDKVVAINLTHTQICRIAIARLWASGEYHFTSRELHHFITTTYGNYLDYNQVLKALFKLQSAEEITKSKVILTSKDDHVRNRYTITQKFPLGAFELLKNGKS